MNTPRLVACLQVPELVWDQEAQTFTFPRTLTIEVVQQGDAIALVAKDDREEAVELDDYLADMIFEHLSEAG
jgi:hypothetical protein